MPMLCLICREVIYPRETIPLTGLRSRDGLAAAVLSENERFWMLCPSCKEQNCFIKEYRAGEVRLCLSHLLRRRGIGPHRGLDTLAVEYSTGV